MKSDSGGNYFQRQANPDDSLSSAEKQRQTAADLARQKVLSAYQSSTNTSSSSRYSATTNSTISTSDWQKYHTAWQNYYQKYYNDYYSNAAREYIETEKLKTARAIADEKQALEDIKVQTTESALSLQTEFTDDTYDSVSNILKSRLQKSAIKHAKKHRRSRHLIPIFSGVIVTLLILFLQYNRLIFAPIIAYVSPGNVEPDSITELNPTIMRNPGPEPKLIIPKLNINVPVAFGIDNDEKVVMDAMNHGVAHFRVPGASSFPGQTGNTVITGHSAGDIYSNNQYKFIFSGLERLGNKDLIYVNYNSARYTYSITKKEVIEPSEVNKLVLDQQKPYLTLITCTPLGTARQRLLIFAEQVSPNVTASQTSTPSPIEPKKPNILPKSEPSFFENVWRFLFRQ